MFFATVRIYYLYFEILPFIRDVLCVFWLGFMLGPFITLIATGFICKSLGWPMVFYIMGEYLSIKSQSLLRT